MWKVKALAISTAFFAALNFNTSKADDLALSDEEKAKIQEEMPKKKGGAKEIPDQEPIVLTEYEEFLQGFKENHYWNLDKMDDKFASIWRPYAESFDYYSIKGFAGVLEGSSLSIKLPKDASIKSIQGKLEIEEELDLKAFTLKPYLFYSNLTSEDNRFHKFGGGILTKDFGFILSHSTSNEKQSADFYYAGMFKGFGASVNFHTWLDEKLFKTSTFLSSSIAVDKLGLLSTTLTATRMSASVIFIPSINSKIVNQMGHDNAVFNQTQVKNAFNEPIGIRLSRRSKESQLAVAFSRQFKEELSNISASYILPNPIMKNSTLSFSSGIEIQKTEANKFSLSASIIFPEVFKQRRLNQFNQPVQSLIDSQLSLQFSRNLVYETTDLSAAYYFVNPWQEDSLLSLNAGVTVQNAEFLTMFASLAKYDAQSSMNVSFSRELQEDESALSSIQFSYAMPFW